MDSSIDFERTRKKTKIYAWLATVAYLVLFPFFLMITPIIMMGLSGDRIPAPVALSMFIFWFSAPLSIPFTIYFIWSRYLQRNYKKSCQFCLLPFCITVAVVAYFSLVDFVLTYVFCE